MRSRKKLNKVEEEELFYTFKHAMKPASFHLLKIIISQIVHEI